MLLIKYKKANESFIKFLETNNKKSSIHYHYGTLLTNTNDQQKAYFQLFKILKTILSKLRTDELLMSFFSFSDNHKNYIKKKQYNENDDNHYEYPRENYTFFEINHDEFTHKIQIYQYYYFDTAEPDESVDYNKEFIKLESEYLTKQPLLKEGVHLRNGKTLHTIYHNKKQPVVEEYTTLKQKVYPLYEKLKSMLKNKKNGKIINESLVNELKIALVIYLRILKKYHESGCISTPTVPWLFDVVQHKKNLNKINDDEYTKNKQDNKIEEIIENKQTSIKKEKKGNSKIKSNNNKSHQKNTENCNSRVKSKNVSLNTKYKTNNNKSHKKNRGKRNKVTAYNKYFSYRYKYLCKEESSSSKRKFENFSKLIADEWKTLTASEKIKWKTNGNDKNDIDCESIHVKLKKKRKRQRDTEKIDINNDNNKKKKRRIDKSIEHDNNNKSDDEDDDIRNIQKETDANDKSIEHDNINKSDDEDDNVRNIQKQTDANDYPTQLKDNDPCLIM